MLTDKEEQDQWFKTEILPHEPILRAWLKNQYSGNIDVDDIIQEAYMRVIKARDTGEIRSPKSLLFKAARNIALDGARRTKVVRINSFTDIGFSDVLDDSIDIPEAIALRHDLDLLSKAIQSLPSRCRQVFTLKKVYGMTQEEVARKLGVSVNTVNTQLKIGVRKCAAFLSKYKMK